MGELPFELIERKVLVKKEYQTNPGYGKYPSERTLPELIDYGIINLNKPPGPTSHQVADNVKKIFKASKVGHGGTLDPKVTGVLPIVLNKATRVVQTLLPAGKEYVALIYLHKNVDKDEIKKVLNQFIGKIEQMPPVRSAVKRQLRIRDIYYLEILEIESQNILVKIGCQGGTYIRKIASDLGEKLGTGAHLKQLVRTKSGPFKFDDSFTLLEVKDAYVLYNNFNDESYLKKILLSIEDGVKHLAKIWINDFAVDSLCHGASLNLPGISKLESNIKVNDLIAIMTLKNELIGVGEANLTSKEMIDKNKGLAVKKTKIFMDRGAYPKFIK